MKKILFCGGGSAGHVIPNLAIIEDLKNKYECVYAGTDGIEKNLCAEHGITFYECPAVKLVRGKFFKNLALPFKLIKSVNSAGKILDSIKPDLIFCKGGYACVPPAIAAKKRDIPVIAHESDLTAGLANKFIAKRCKKVLTSFPATAKQFDIGICTGSPMRGNIFYGDKLKARETFGLDMRPTILVLGGGSGSKIINENLRKIIPTICRHYNVLHICGKGNYLNSNIYGYKQIEFSDDMGKIYACADVAVSRCGSNTAFELLALKIPTLFIPLANSASRGDQIKNADYFKSLGLCNVLNESDLTPDTLYNETIKLLKDGKLKAALNGSNVKSGNENIIREIINTIR